jgi:mRNA interferase RelE/StbE
MAFRILIKPSALSELAKIPKSYATQIAEAIDSLSKNPWPKGYRKLKGLSNHYRFRIGNYRVVYSVEKKILLIEIIRIWNQKQHLQEILTF